MSIVVLFNQSLVQCEPCESSISIRYRMQTMIVLKWTAPDPMAKKSKKTHVIAVTIAVECQGIDEAVPHKGERLHHQLIKVSGVLRRSGETVFSREMKSSADVKNEEFFKRLTTCCVNGTVAVFTGGTLVVDSLVQSSRRQWLRRDGLPQNNHVQSFSSINQPIDLLWVVGSWGWSCFYCSWLSSWPVPRVLREMARKHVN